MIHREANVTEPTDYTPQPPRITLATLAWTALYVGIAGYGGGPAIIGYLKELFVNRYRWVDEETFFAALSLSQLLPGANALSVIEFLGYNVCGSLGAIVAPICFIFPAFVLMTVLSAVYFTFGQVPLATALFTGLGAVVVALLANALVILGRSAIKNLWAVVIAVLAFLAVFLFHVPILVIVLGCAVLGFLLYRGESKPVNAVEVAVPATSASTPWWFWPAWVVITLVVALALIVTYHSTSTQLFLSLLRVGALTFGGGYMSVPLFQHEAVVAHQWLTNRQFLDGIALGQITPGPVLITGTFIGYRVLGVWGALVGTIAVFLPGGLAMFFLAHQHERLSQLEWLRAMVRGVVAGFIGVLFNVILQLAQQSITDWKTASLAVVALLVLLVAKKDPLWVILGAVVVSPLLFR